jgi:DNA-binding response OmpR family regulator
LYPRFAVIRVVLLTDRTPAQVLPGAPPLLLDLKTEHLSVATVAEALAVLHALRERGPRIPVLVVVERRDVDRFPWEEVADDVIFPGALEGEIRLRFALARRRTGTGEETAIRLGPIVLDPSTYRVSLEGTPLDLTFKEFELLRYLAERRGRVFTRPALLREVWGYDFYGGTRTVDVHVRRLRSKLGPAHEGLVETVRGVGYRAADV